MELLIFDMDGVLLEPLGYHHALRETVRLAGETCGFSDVQLSAEQIARFEALGISSEWHSSALCMAWMTLQKAFAPASQNPDWEHLVAAFQRQPQANSPIQRGAAALAQVAQERGVSADRAVALMHGMRIHSRNRRPSTGSRNWCWAARYLSVFTAKPGS